MLDVSKVLVKVAAGPWRAGLMLVGTSFLLATVTSTVMVHFIAPSAVVPVARPKAGGRGFSVPEPTASLTAAAIDVIVKRNIFNAEGAAQDADKAQGTAPGQKQLEAIKSDLPITLVGTIFSGDPYSGIALIENTSKKTINSFMVGDALLKEAILKEIHKERIIIDHNGRPEFIEVVREKLSRSRRQKKAVPAATDSVAPIATEPPPPSFKEEGFERKDRDMTMSQAYRSKLLTTDFTKVLQDAKASPNLVDGELKGFVLTRIRKDSIYEKAGLQNDDIVTEIQGVPLTDTAQAIRLLQSLRGESEIEIRLNRAGSPLKFNLNVK